MAVLRELDRVLLSFVGKFFDQTIVSTFGYQATDVTGGVNQNTFFAAADTLVKGAFGLQEKYLAACPPQFTLLERWWQVYLPDRYAAFKFAENTPGTFVGQAVLPNIAGVIVRRGEIADRKNVSTLHVPIGDDSDCIDSGRLTDDLMLALNDLAGILDNVLTVTGATLNPVIPNFNSAVNPVLIVQAFAKNTARTMSRRTVGRGI